MKPTEEQVKKWSRGLNAVWQTIGGDILVDEEGKIDEGKSIPRAEVFDLASDCYFEMYSKLAKDEIKEFYDRDRKHDKLLMKKAFPFLRYGW